MVSDRTNNHRLVALLLAVVMLAQLLPAAALKAWAADGDEANAAGTQDEPTSVTADDTTWYSGWYIVDDNVTNTNRILVSGDVHLILQDDCTLTVPLGITVSAGNSLTIDGGEGAQGTGALIAGQKATYCYAGIGGYSYLNDTSKAYATAGTITINGGNVTATGGYAAAGIGSGGYSEAAGGTVTINGGNVTATGGKYAAGIGSGASTDGSNDQNILDSITITGGNVTATGGDSADGIGSGSHGATNSIVIDGEKVLVVASSISKASINHGVIFQNYNGQVYGDVTLAQDLALPESSTLTVPSGSELTVASGATLAVASGETLANQGGTITVNGKLVLPNDQALKDLMAENGSFAGSGVVTTAEANATYYSMSYQGSDQSTDDAGELTGPVWLQALPEAQARTGYTFAGWYTAAGGDELTHVETAADAAGKTLYARYTLDAPTVTLASPEAISKGYDGKNAELAVQATHALNESVSYTYAWYKNCRLQGGTPVVSEDDAPLGTSASLYVCNVADSGTYYCRVTASDGAQTAVAWSPRVTTTITAIPLENAAVAIAAPVKNEAPASQATVDAADAQSLYTAGDVRWSLGENALQEGSKFLGGESYTATLTLTSNPDANYAFDVGTKLTVTAGDEILTLAAPNYGEERSAESQDGTTKVTVQWEDTTEWGPQTLRVEITFPPTEPAQVHRIAIEQNPDKRLDTYAVGETFDASGLVVAVYNDDGTLEESVAYNDHPERFSFSPETVAEGTDRVTVTYNYNGTATAELQITVIGGNSLSGDVSTTNPGSSTSQEQPASQAGNQPQNGEADANAASSGGTILVLAAGAVAAAAVVGGVLWLRHAGLLAHKLSGVVTDAEGNAVPNATVTVQQMQGGRLVTVQTVKTNASGAYQFSAPDGEYTLTAQYTDLTTGELCTVELETDAMAKAA